MRSLSYEPFWSASDGSTKRIRFQSTQDGHSVGVFILIKRQNDECNVRKIRRFHSGEASSENLVRGCACRTSKFWLSLYLFLSPFTTHHYTDFVKKYTPFRPNWVLLRYFLLNLRFGCFVCDENPPIAIQKISEKAPKKAGTYIYVYPPGFSVVWVLIYRHSMSAFLQVTLNFELE